MLRTEKQVALDTVINSGLRSIDHYCRVGESIQDEQAGTLLDQLARERKRLIDKLTPKMYKLGDMPSSPDPEKLAVEEIFTRIKAAFSKDEKNELLASLDEIDSQLMQDIDEAFRLDFDEETMAILRELQASAAGARKKRERIC